MKRVKVILFLGAMLILSNGYGQTLSIQETINYINKKLSENKRYEKISLSKEGILTIDNAGVYTTKTEPYYDKEEKTYKTEKMLADKCQMKISSIEITEVSCTETILSRACSFKIKCKDKNTICMQCASSFSSYNSLYKYIGKGYYYEFSMVDDYEARKIRNAFEYLFAKVAEDGTYIPVRTARTDDNDPFSPSNYTGSVISNTSNQTIQLEKNGNIYSISVSIGTIRRKFILDSGASDVSISENFERELINAGTITQKNYIASALYKLANGSIVECKRLLLPEMKVGDYTVKNVVVSVTKGSDDVLLLGKSFLDKFSKWTIDNNTQTLKLEK